MGVPQRFALATPRFGRSRGGVQVAGALVVEHPLVGHAIAVPYEQMAGFAAGADLEQRAPDLVLERDLRILTITGRPGAPAGVVVVLRTPIEVGPFKRGADRVLPISGRERRTGIEVSILEFGVEDAEGLAKALQAAGLRAAPLPRLLREVGGEAIGPAREERIQASVAAYRRVVLAMTGAAVLSSLVVATRVLELVAEDVDWSLGFIAQLAVSSLLCMLLSAAWLLRPGRAAPVGAPEAPAPRGPARSITVVILAVGAFVAIAVAGADLPRPALVGLGALASGGLGGLVPRAGPAAGGPAVARHRCPSAPATPSALGGAGWGRRPTGWHRRPRRLHRPIGGRRAGGADRRHGRRPPGRLERAVQRPVQRPPRLTSVVERPGGSRAMCRALSAVDRPRTGGGPAVRPGT